MLEAPLADEGSGGTRGVTVDTASGGQVPGMGGKFGWWACR